MILISEVYSMVSDQYRQIKLIKNALDVMEANLVVDMTFS